MVKDGKELAKLKEEGKLLKAKVTEKGLSGGKDAQKDEETSELQSQLKDIESCIKTVKKRSYEQVAELKKAAIVLKRELGDIPDQDSVLRLIMIIVIGSKVGVERSQ